MHTGPAVPNTHEPNLSDIAGVFVRRKWSGVLIVFLSLAVGATVSFLLPKRYVAQEVLRIATRDGVPVESVESITTVLSSISIQQEIATALHITTDEVRDDVQVDAAGGGRLVLVTGRGEMPEQAMRATKIVSAMVLERMRAAYVPAREFLDKEISTLIEEQKKVTEEIARLERVRERLTADVQWYQREIERRADAESEGQGRIVEAYILLLSDVKFRQDAVTQGVADAKQRLIVLDEEIGRKRLSPSYTLIAPGVEVEASSPKLSAIPGNLVQHFIFAFVIGAFLAVAWILIREYHVVRRHDGR